MTTTLLSLDSHLFVGVFFSFLPLPLPYFGRNVFIKLHIIVMMCAFFKNMRTVLSVITPCYGEHCVLQALSALYGNPRGTLLSALN